MLAGRADGPAVVNHAIGEREPLGLREEGHEVALDVHRIVVVRKPELLREPEPIFS